MRIAFRHPRPICPAMPSLAPTSPRLWPRAVLITLVKGYRLLLSPWLGNACRFEPTCSRYAIGALERHGAAAGTYLAVARILRCSPLCAGGCDPVPERRPPLFSRLFPAATSAAPESMSSSRPLP
jgi:uncharacterized protein